MLVPNSKYKLNSNTHVHIDYEFSIIDSLCFHNRDNYVFLLWVNVYTIDNTAPEYVAFV